MRAGMMRIPGGGHHGNILVEPTLSFSQSVQSSGYSSIHIFNPQKQLSELEGITKSGFRYFVLQY